MDKARKRGSEGTAALPSAAEGSPIKPQAQTRSAARVLKGAGTVLALLLGFLLLLVSISEGDGILPAAKSYVQGMFASLLPSWGPGDIAQLTTVMILGVAVGLLAVGSFAAANAVFGAFSTVPPSLEGSARSSPVIMSLGADVSEAMIKAGVTGRPLALVRRYAVYAMASAIVIVPTSMVAAWLLDQPLVLLVNVVPILFLFYPTMATKSKVGDTVRGVDEELPYFSVVAAILQSAGMTLYDALTKIAKAKMFRWMEYEGKLIARESVFFGKTQTGAIVERGAQHPSEKFRTYLQGYTSIMASGGDAASYLEEKAKDLIYWTEFRWRSYGQSASDLGEAIIAIFFTLPLIVIAGAFVSPGDTLALIVGTVVVVIPVMAVIEYSAIIKIQPKNYDTVKGWTVPGIVAAIICGGMAVFFNQPSWLVIAVGILGWAVVYGASTWWQLREIRKCEEALPQFMRDITEYKKIGYDITKAIRRLATERHYNKKFDSLLENVSTQLKLGSPLKDVIVKTRSWMTRMVFYMLGEVVESGGGTPALLETVTDFTHRIVNVRQETKSSMRVYGFLAYATPIGLAIVIITMYYMLQQFGGILGTGASAGILSGSVTLPPSFLDLAKILVVEAAAVVGFLAGRAIDFTNKSSFRIASGVALSIVGIILIQILIPALGILSTQT